MIRVKETRTSKKNEMDVLYRKIGKNQTTVETVVKWVLDIIASYNIEIGEVNINLRRDDIAIYNRYLSSEKENSVATHNPELLNEWDYDKNGIIMPTNISYGSKKSVWWICPMNHSYKAMVSHRTDMNAPTSCPICAGQKILSGYNDLATKRPDLMREWDFENNELNPNAISPNSYKKIFSIS